MSDDTKWFSDIEKAFNQKREGAFEKNGDMNGLKMAAEQLMKQYQSYISVGFSPDQAIKLTCETIYAITVATLVNKTR